MGISASLNHCGEVDMSAVTWTSEKSVATRRRSLARRLFLGPALIVALCICSSGVLAAALLLSSILQF